MRNQWRQQLLLLHRCYHSSVQVSTSHFRRFQVPSFSNSFHRSTIGTPFYGSQFLRVFSSGLAVNPPKHSIFEKEVALLKDFFSKTELELEPNSVVLNRILVYEALEDLRSSPDVALKLFNWVLESDDWKILRSESCRLMLNILLDNSFLEEFSDTWGKVGRKFPFQRFPWFVECESKIQNVVYRFIESESWSNDLEEKLRIVEYSSDMVSWIVRKLGLKDDKGLVFFKWIKESGLFRHDQHTFNAMLEVLAKEESSQRFWNMAEEMKNSGFEMEQGTRNIAKERLFEKKTEYDFVNYLEFAMGGVNKVSVEDCSSLLTTALVRSEKVDMERFSFVVRNFKTQGIVITDYMFKDIVWSLVKIDSLRKINKILKALEVEGGFIPHVLIPDNMESSNWSYRTYSYLISAFCLKNDLEKASSTLQAMVENVGFYSCKVAIHTVVEAYCDNQSAMDAFNLVSKLVQENDAQPWLRTYKILIKGLLADGRSTEASDAVRLIKFKYSRKWLFYLIPEFCQFNELDKASRILQDTVKYLDAIDSKDSIHTVVEAYCRSNELEKASSLLQDMVKIVDAIDYKDAIHMIVEAYCDKERAVDAYNLVSKLMLENDVCPRQATMELLLSKLMAQGGFREVLNALPLFEKTGCKRPTLALFIEHLSKSGSPDDAVAFVETMTNAYKFSLRLFLQRLLKAYLELGKLDCARELVSKCRENSFLTREDLESLCYEFYRRNHVSV